MEAQPPNYRSEFLKSPHHVWLGLLTLGIGFLAAHPLPLIIGATAYALGWIYLPDMSFFRRWVDQRHDNIRKNATLAQVNDFIQRRDRLLQSLSATRRSRYAALAEVCRNIESASAENPGLTNENGTDPRLRKLDELMWTFLRLLSIEESLDRFLETEQQEDIPRVVKEAEAELARLSAELEALKAKGGTALDTKQRFVGSRLERLEVLRKRLDRINQARENLALVISEQERLDQQIKLIRADAVATKNADALTARIDATVEHLDQTNKWLSEMDEFKDLVGDMPASEMRIGFESQKTAPPLIPQPEFARTKNRP
ncbi:MAG: hypothetical protein JWM68_2302, partial [Verrucomicrobiales bacterium]|nr:hypothetical protein [Verrucomicrobiales bacterium]